MKKYYIYCKDLKTGGVTCSLFSYPLPVAESLKSQMALTAPGCEVWLEEDKGAAQ